MDQGFVKGEELCLSCEKDKSIKEDLLNSKKDTYGSNGAPFPRLFFTSVGLTTIIQMDIVNVNPNVWGAI